MDNEKRDHHSQDISSNLAQDQDSDFTKMVNRALSRRQFFKVTTATSVGAFFTASPMAQAVTNLTRPHRQLMGFDAIPASIADRVYVPKGYRADVLISWGDPIFEDAPEFDPSGKTPASAQARQMGDNNDGMSLFPLSEHHAVLAVNNEYINPDIMFAHKGENVDAEDVKTGQAAHGVSIFEIKKEKTGWTVIKDGKLNRRITANTEMELTGPAAGHALMKTSTDSTGKKVLGTFNNCANGQTPWGTYLTCEENFHYYFGSTDGTLEVPAHLKRYGIKTHQKRYQWHQFDPRFDIAKNINEPNRHGWVVEIDPMNPNSTPKKRTALGHFKHENAALVIDGSGHIVVYMGDDERGEHLYKFVSKRKYHPDDQTANRDLLEEGRLYVAKFEAEDGELKGKGQWIALTHGENGLTQENGFADQGEVLIKTRLAATTVGATTMDRPEWVAIHPNKSTVFCTLTNNKHRGKKSNQPVGGPNPRSENHYGQIVRWKPINGNHTASEFEWDLFVLAGNPYVHKDTLYAGSPNITMNNLFNSPDGLGFDADGRLWIQTDGNYSNEGDFIGMGNNQMLCGDPETGEIRRFLTGPVACEITGLTFTPDYRTLFVGIQHPGEKGKESHFPAGGSHKPRSTIMVITREDGGVIGT